MKSNFIIYLFRLFIWDSGATDKQPVCVNCIRSICAVFLLLTINPLTYFLFNSSKWLNIIRSSYAHQTFHKRLEMLEEALLHRPNSRNYCLIVMGLNTALRISDLLRLKWDNVYNFEHHEFRTHFLINEQKTGKSNYVTLNCNATDALKDYFNERHPDDHEFIFTKNTSRYQPISRTQAYRIVKTAAGKTVQDEHISCHSLRKTFGYHAWKNGTPPALLMDVYNHSSYAITQHYLGIEQDERDEIFLKLEL